MRYAYYAGEGIIRWSMCDVAKARCLSKAFAKSESGATAIEYGLIAAGISVAIIAVVNGLGTQLNNTFARVKTSLSSQ